jgi:hypothetical protein
VVTTRLVGWRWAVHDKGKKLARLRRHGRHELGCRGRRPWPGQKGEAGWAERDFEPMKPLRFKKALLFFGSDSNSN